MAWLKENGASAVYIVCPAGLVQEWVTRVLGRQPSSTVLKPRQAALLCKRQRGELSPSRVIELYMKIQLRKYTCKNVKRIVGKWKTTQRHFKS